MTDTTKPTIDTFKELWKRQLSLQVLLFTIVLIINIILMKCSTVTSTRSILIDEFTYLSAILLFTIFDVLGWWGLVRNMSDLIRKYSLFNNDTIRYSSACYRIMQHLFQVSLCIILYLFVGWKVVLLFILAWWFGLCDILYYVLIRNEERIPDELTWMNWSIHIIWKLTGTKCTAIKFIVMGFLGFVIGMFTLYFWR